MSEINFKNGSELKILCYDPASKNVRGNRSKIIGSQCYDVETGQWVFREWNMDEPIGRYIPEFMFMVWAEEEGDKNI